MYEETRASGRKPHNRVGSFVRYPHFPPHMNKKQLNFHAESDDILGTLATVFDLLVQRMRTGRVRSAEILRFLTAKRDELAYLQKFYRIEKRSEPEV